MQIKKYIPNEYSSKLDNFKIQYSIKELSKINDIQVTVEIMRIIKRWLKLSKNCENICNDETIELILDHIFDECSNLELQEINYIFKEGIKGKFGIIYNEIGIDTILGINGWIETFYKTRNKRTERNENIIEAVYSGKEMTLKEFHEKNPDYRKRMRLSEIYEKAKNYKINTNDVYDFYSLLGLTEKEYSEDVEVYIYNFEVFETQKGIELKDYIKNQDCEFIKKNYFLNAKIKK